MALTVTRSDVWAASIVDRAGGLAEKLTALAEAARSWSLSFRAGHPTRRAPVSSS